MNCLIGCKIMNIFLPDTAGRNSRYQNVSFLLSLIYTMRPVHCLCCYIEAPSHDLPVNIHSHWGGAVLFAYLLCTDLPGVLAAYDTDGVADLLYLLVFGLAAIICLLFSGIYHMAECHSPELATFCHKLDYSGISILIVGSMYPGIFYSFYCHPSFRNFYLAAVTIAGLGAAYVTLSPEYSRPTYRRLRTYVFISLGLGGAIPAIHSIHLHGLEHMREELGLDWLLYMAGLYIIGALIYAERIPERFWPGRFDLFGGSHQIFHFCVVAAALCHYRGLLESVKYVHGVANGRCPWENGNGW